MVRSGVPELDQTAFELEIARLIAEVVKLDHPPEKVDPTAPMFDDGLGLDSIDLLEIALAISQTYGFSLRSDDNFQTGMESNWTEVINKALKIYVDDLKEKLQ